MARTEKPDIFSGDFMYIRVCTPPGINTNPITPVFDSCLQVLVVDIEENRQISRSELYLDQLSPSQRLDVLRHTGVTTLICGGISDVFHSMIKSAGITTIIGIAGEIEEVLGAFLSNRLDQPYFYMPGYAGK